MGLGKSFTALASVQHAHNIGIKKKTAFVVPNSVLSNWRKEASVALEDMSQCLFVGLNIDAKGKAKAKTALGAGMLSGGASPLLDADGAAVVIHADADDEMTDPSGKSGKRVLCGVLKVR